MFKIDTAELNIDNIPIDPYWNVGDEKELKIHRIHSYPAKFPAFITTKALSYADEHNIKVRKIADIFCGCGTVAFEAKRNNIDFWGCDINPVATMIAKVKSRSYKSSKLEEYLAVITKQYPKKVVSQKIYIQAHPRLKYWFTKRQYEDLFRLKACIDQHIPTNSAYRAFFLCAFSNILKPASRWLTKSIKPQKDPKKKSERVCALFKKQCQFMFKAYEEDEANGTPDVKIITSNFLDSCVSLPKVDLIVTSPPYVTSYEYADLHQLSSLWLNYSDDHRKLRKGSIGSLYHEYSFQDEQSNLNKIGRQIVDNLLINNKSKARSVAKYFLHMQQVTDKCSKMLAPNGMALFVIGNTEYKNVRIDNARHLIEAMTQSGFNEIKATKRKITGKILTPYRNKEGRFSTNKKSRKIYAEEFIVIGRK